MAHAVAASPPASSRLLGLLGILGGAVLLAAFLPFIPWTADFINLRLALFNIGAMAIVVAVHRRQAPVAPRLALLAAVPAFLANAWYLAMIVGVVARPGEPGVGDFGPVVFTAGAAMWLADAAFGLVILRLGVVTRWGGLALTVGSVLAFSGMGNLELVTGPYADLFVPLALIGVGLNGLGWILLGIDVATHGRGSRTER